jgi:hypothetical protein
MMSSIEATKDVMRVFDNRKEMKAETPMCQGVLRMVFYDHCFDFFIT